MATLTYKKEKIKENENRLKYKSYLKSFKKNYLCYFIAFNFINGIKTIS